MNINIVPNSYREETECRENIVQYICDAFLERNCRQQFHPTYTKSQARDCTRYVVVENGKGVYIAKSPNYAECYEIRKCEVELALKLLQENGYYLYRYMLHRDWVTYSISGNPRMTQWERVNKIRDCEWSFQYA